MNQHVRPATNLPVWLVLALVALGIPRTVLSDLDVVAPESGLLYYCLALVPFATWLAVAVVRRNRRPFTDFLLVGALYGLSLVIVHQLMSSEGLGLKEIGIAMTIGIGTGLVVGLVALAVAALRRQR